MPYELRCGDVLPRCEVAFEADTEADLLDLVADHAGRDHTDVVIDDSVLERVKGAIRHT